MNIKELKELIKDLPDEMEVCSRDTKWIREQCEVYVCEVFDEDFDKGIIDKFLVVE